MASYMPTDLDEYHENSRRNVCIVCYRKAKRQPSANDITGIRNFVIENYDINNSDLPSGLCNGCYLLLNKKINGLEAILPVSDDYDPVRPKNFRGLSECTCQICRIARSQLNEATKLKKRRGRPPSTSNMDTRSEERDQIFKICGSCFTKLYRGCKHDCTRRQKVYNMEKMASPQTRERLASRIAMAGTSLSTLGSKPKIVPGQAKEPYTISVEDLSEWQKNMSLGVRGTHKIAENLRKATKSRKESC